jgi:hypothetical protein
LISDKFTTDVTKWAIDDVGVYVENPEFVYVKTDNEGKILWAIKTDGSIYYGAGVPQQVVDYINEKIAELSLDEYEDIVAFLNGLEEGDKTLQTLLNEKVDKEEGKSLIDAEYADGVHYIENPEFAGVWLDGEDKILFGIEQDGNFLFGCGIPRQVKEYIEQKIEELSLDEYESIVNFIGDYLNNTTLEELLSKKVDGEYVENPEYIQVTTDSEGKMLEGITSEGLKRINLPIDTPSATTNHIENPEWISVLLDKEGKIISAIKKNGDYYYGFGIPSQIKEALSEKEDKKDYEDINKRFSKSILDHKVCISDMETFKAAHGLLSFYDGNNNNVYALYMGSKFRYGEMHVDDVLLTIFPLLQPFKAKTLVVVETGTPYKDSVINHPDVSTMCEFHDNEHGDSLRIFFTTTARNQYYYRDFYKETETFGEIHDALLAINSEPVPFTLEPAKSYLEAQGGDISEVTSLIMLTNIIYHSESGYHYGILCFNTSNPVLFRSNDNCATIEFVSILPTSCSFEACPCFVGDRLYVTIRKGNCFMYYTDDFGLTWNQFNIIPNDIVSQQRAKLLEYKGKLYIFHSIWNGGGKNQIWGGGRDNVRVLSYDKETQLLTELLFIQDNNGIVYYDALIVADNIYFMFTNSDLFLDYDIYTSTHQPQGKDIAYFVKLLELN